MSQCIECGRELTTAGPDQQTCEDCRRREYAEQAEQTAAEGSQQHFVVTNILLAINIGVFLWMAIRRVPIISPSADDIVHWGANYGPLTLGGQPWRLVTAVFLHIGLAHIAFNMWALLVLGRLAEALYGWRSYLTTYLIAGVAGSLASLLWNPLAVSAGASGALFGLLGALITTLYFGSIPIPRHRVRPVLGSLVFWAAFDLIYGIYKSGMDNAAHIGGLIAGLAIGAALGHHLGPSSRSHRFRVRLWAVSGVALVALGLGVYRLNGYVADLTRARELLVKGKTDQAIPKLEAVTRRKPKEMLVHLLLGDAYTVKGDLAKAEQQFKIVVAENPKSAGTWDNLGTLYMKEGRLQDAADAFTHAAQTAKNGGASWYNAGLMYRQMGNYTSAITAFQNAVARDPNLANAWYALGISYLNQRLPAKAVGALQRASCLQPNDPEMHQWLGNALVASGEGDKAEAEYFRAGQLRSAQRQSVPH